MSNLPGRSSLGRKLSLWIAVQVLMGLTVISIVVYLVIANHLDTRQTRTLTENKALVMHWLDEAKVDRDIDELLHRFDDFHAGHNDIGLEIVGLNEVPLYSSPAAQKPSAGFRRVEFLVNDFPVNDFPGPAVAILTHSSEIDEALLSRLAITLLLVTLLGSTFVSWGVFVLVRRSLRPVNDLAKQTLQLSASTLESRLDGSNQPTELQPLVIQFNRLLERLSASYSQLEAFNADVAHELNTPLTTLVTSTELALRRPVDPATLNDILRSNLEELHRMSGIIRDMLFLSQAERGSLARRTSVASLASIANEVAEYHEASLSDTSLDIKIEGDAAGEFDVSLIKRALSNMLGNAARFADPGTTLHVDIERQEDHGIKISVVNQGEVISLANQEKLFDRFFRADTARASGEQHHGLGLSIVAGIAHMHGGEPFVESRDHTTRIGFSLSPNNNVSG